MYLVCDLMGVGVEGGDRTCANSKHSLVPSRGEYQ